jgi:LemA protein
MPSRLLFDASPYSLSTQPSRFPRVVISDIILLGKKVQKMAGWIITLIVGLIALWVIITYNTLIAQRNHVKNAWKQIDVQLKRRHDLIPNLVATVKGYMQFERDTLERVTEARTRALAASDIREKAVSEGVLTRSLKTLFAVMENYPVLKSNENVLQLQEELISTENKIAFSRQLYNDLAVNLATKIEVFPNNIIASLFAFQRAEYFSADESEKKVPSAEIMR